MYIYIYTYILKQTIVFRLECSTCKIYKIEHIIKTVNTGRDENSNYNYSELQLIVSCF